MSNGYKVVMGGRRSAGRGKQRGALFLAFLAGIVVGMQITKLFWFGVYVDPPISCNHHEDPQNLVKKYDATSMSKETMRELLNPPRIQSTEDSDNSDTTSMKSPHFGPGVSKFASGAVRTSRDDFLKEFDYGLPLPLFNDQHNPGISEVLMLYGEGVKNITRAESKEGSEMFPVVSVEEATAQCNDVTVMHVKQLHGEKYYPCLAVVAGYGNHQLLRWKRDKASGKFQRIGLKGRYMRIPEQDVEENHRESIERFLHHMDVALEELRPIVERIEKENTVVVMCINKGYVPMLMNFVCSSKSRNIDLSSVLVFATDQDSFDAAKKLGLEAFHTAEILGAMPTKEAAVFGDKTFSLLTYSGFASVLLINLLGRDVLFQDADLVWYKHPFEYFHDKNNAAHSFDIMFMDDGNNGWEYIPYRANTGFYYVRQNERTRHLFNSLIYSGDLIASSGVDQIVMSVLLNEHSTRHGLNVKTLDVENFPGGWTYHRKSKEMNKILNGEVVPWIFHMHWTHNRVHKLEYMKQSALWYVQEKCVDSSFASFDADATNHCCSLEPLISCHHSDKPSVPQCKNK